MIAEKNLPLQGAQSTSEKQKLTAADIYDITAAMGELFFGAVTAIGQAIFDGVFGLLAALVRGWGYVSGYLKRFFAKLAQILIVPFIRYRRALKIGKTEISKAKAEKGTAGTAAATTKVAGRLLFGKRGFFVTVVNWVLPVLSCMFLFNIITFATSQMYAIRLTVNGNFIGYIEDESVYSTAEKAVHKRINFTGSNTQAFVFEPSYEVATIGYGSTLNSNQLTDKILELIDADIADGYGMYIGEQYYGTLTEHSRVDSALDALLDKYRTGSAKESVAFDKEVSFVPGKYMVDSFVDENEMIDMLTSYKQVATYYTVVYGDSAAAIARKVDMTYEEISALNGGNFNAYTPVHVGDKIKITQEEPYLTVIITREEHYDEYFAFDTVYNDDSTIFKGDKLIKRAGKNGQRAVVANVSYINGVEVNRHVLSRTVTKEPVTQIVSVGTKPRTANSASAQTVEAGNYLWPVGGNGGTISCLPWMAQGGYYHSYYGHNGLDIAASYGTPIYAAGTGTVIAVSSGWNYGFGNMVKIRHDDGKETWYAHMSGFSSTIYTGKRVTMGECIGYVGSTGNSSGNHLHFEVRINGRPQYPPDYLPAHRTAWGTYV